MSRVPHTPGPWAFDPDHPEIYGEVNSAAICKVMEADDFPCLEEGTHSDVQDECFANRRLIAAAPDLLAALKEMEAADDISSIGRALQASRAAIAKAEGAA